MNKWIKPSELPQRFWGECFVAVYHEGEILVEINYVKASYPLSKFYSETEKEWIDFNSDESDIAVMLIEYPEITLEEFK